MQPLKEVTQAELQQVTLLVVREGKEGRGTRPEAGRLRRGWAVTLT